MLHFELDADRLSLRTLEQLTTRLRQRAPDTLRAYFPPDMEKSVFSHCLAALRRHFAKFEVYFGPEGPTRHSLLTQLRSYETLVLDGWSLGKAERLFRKPGEGLPQLKVLVPFQHAEEPIPELADALARWRPQPAEVEVDVGWKSGSRSPAHISRDHYTALASLVVQTAVDLTRLHIPISFGCGVPLCMFSRNQLGRLATCLVKGRVAVCGDQWRISANGDLRFCSLLASESTVRLQDHASFPEAAERAQGPYRAFMSFCLHPEHSPCVSHMTGACAGGCLALRIGSWRGRSASFA